MWLCLHLGHLETEFQHNLKVNNVALYNLGSQTRKPDDDLTQVDLSYSQLISDQRYACILQVLVRHLISRLPIGLQESLQEQMVLHTLLFLFRTVLTPESQTIPRFVGIGIGLWGVCVKS